MLANLEFYDSLRFFSAAEFKYPEQMSQDFLQQLDWARHYAGVPFAITDDYRLPDNDMGVKLSAHKEGKAVDLKVSNSHQRYAILRGLILAGFTRVGMYDRHIHADRSTKLPQEVVWIGKSK